METPSEAQSAVEASKDEGILLPGVDKKCPLALLQGDDEVAYYVSSVARQGGRYLEWSDVGVFGAFFNAGLLSRVPLLSKSRILSR